MRPSVEKLKRMSKTKAMRLENSLASDCDYGEMINPIKPVKACFVWTKPLFSYKRKSLIDVITILLGQRPYFMYSNSRTKALYKLVYTYTSQSFYKLGVSHFKFNIDFGKKFIRFFTSVFLIMDSGCLDLGIKTKTD